MPTEMAVSSFYQLNIWLVARYEQPALRTGNGENVIFNKHEVCVCVFVCEMSEGGMKKEHPPTHSCQIEQQIRPRLLVWQERFQAQLS